MPITEKQREQRRKHLGASDMPKVLGVSPWGNAADVYYDKVDGIDQPETEAMAIGKRYERPLLDWAAQQLGVPIRRNVRRVKPGTPLAAHLDAVIPSRPSELIEGKMSSLLAEWGEPGTDEVPMDNLVQALTQMFVADAELVWMPVLLVRPYRLPKEAMYCVGRDEAAIQAIVEPGLRFWNEHVVPRVPPTDVAPNIEVLKRLPRVPDKTVPVDSKLYAAALKLKRRRRNFDKHYYTAIARLLHQLGDAECGECAGGTLTYFKQKRGEYSVPAAEFRVPRFKEKRG